MNEAKVRKAFQVATELAQQSPDSSFYEALFQSVFSAMLVDDDPGQPAEPPATARKLANRGTHGERKKK